MIRKVLALFLLLVLLGILAMQELERRWLQPLTIPAEGIPLIVSAGDSLRGVITSLHSQGVVAYPNLIILRARYTGDDQKIKRGEYLVPPHATAESLLELLKSGKVIQYQVTLPEGITLAQALTIMASQTRLEQVIDGPEDPRILELVKPRLHPEGLFFPDTYHFDRGTTDWDLLQRAHTMMLTTLDKQWQDRAPGLPYATAYEALIMASIIERETGLPAERQQIAGVFVRRLQTRMRLQTDPTVIYGEGRTFDGNLTRAHLADETNPYNTYRHGGLPPTPIALPGEASIHAALHPDESDALFFVARGDGGHVFSATLAEHQAAVRQYQLRRRSDYRSSPGKP